MKEYEINEETMAIIPLNESVTEVYEQGNRYFVDQNVMEIMENSCRYFGSSLEGRKKGTEYMTGVSYKAPIIVEESKELIFFPTNSLRVQECSWISLKHIKTYYHEDNHVRLIFMNGDKIILNISYGIFDNQILRATRLESALRGHKNSKKTF